MDVIRNAREELLSGFSPLDREKAETALNNGYSVHGYVDGKPYWVNPDDTATQQPKMPICLTIDEDA